MTKPFIKWAGGKTRLLPELIKRIPDKFDVYYEPFLGGGALFFAIQDYVPAYLSDANWDLVNAYNYVKFEPVQLLAVLAAHENQHCERYYYEIRNRYNFSSNPLQKAADFIYLNKTCFNGLYRVNASGLFNVPMGKYKDPKICEPDLIHECRNKLKRATVFQSNFNAPIPTGFFEEKRFFYLDPPYDGTFTKYTKGGFGPKEQENLRDVCDKIDVRKDFFMQSNSDTELIRALYKNYRIEEVSAPRTISQDGEGRQNVTELIIRNY